MRRVPRVENGRNKKGLAASAKECAYIAVFVAFTIAAQLALSFIPGVEIVTVLFVSFSYAFGIKRGMAAATAFSLLRQIVFGFYPVVLVLYLVYYDALAAVCGALGRSKKKGTERLPQTIVTACVCTVGFTMLDNLLTPLWYAFSWNTTRAYFISSLPFMLAQTACVGLTVATLFLPLNKVFTAASRTLS